MMKKYPYSRHGKPYTEPQLILLADIDEHPWLPEGQRNDIREMYQRHRQTLALFIGNIELAYRRGIQVGEEGTKPKQIYVWGRYKHKQHLFPLQFDGGITETGSWCGTGYAGDNPSMTSKARKCKLCERLEHEEKR